MRPWQSIPLLMLALGLLAPAVSAEDAPDPVLRIGVEQGIRTLDPHLAAGPMALHVAEACYEGLCYIDPETLRPVPGLAASWSTSPDRRTWTFRLRKDAQWSDGVRITAQQVARGFRRALDPATDAPFAFALHGLRGATAWHAHGQALLGLVGPRGLIAALQTKAARSPEGLTAAQWARWIGRDALPAILDGAEEPLLREALRGSRAHWSPADLARLVTSLEQAAARMQRTHAAAAETFGRTEGVVAVDAETVRIELTRPDPHLLALLAMPVAAPVPPVAYVRAERGKDTAARNGPGQRAPTRWWLSPSVPVSGPYRCRRRVTRRGAADFGVVLERSAAYRAADTIRQARIEVVVVEGGGENLRRFTQGRIDWARSWPSAVTQKLARTASMRMAESNVIAYYALRCDHPLLADPRARRALSKCIDRAALLAELPEALGRPATTLVPAAVPGYESPGADLAFDLGFDVETARSLWAAVFPEGPPPDAVIELVYNVSNDNRAVAAFVAAAWRRHLGARVRLVPVTWFEYRVRRLLGEFTVSRAGWIGEVPSPLPFLALFEGDSPENVTRWSDPAYDALVARARDAVDPATRMQLCREAEHRLLDLGTPCIPLYAYRHGDLVQPWVRGFRTRAVGAAPGQPGAHNVQGLHPFRGLWKEARPR